MVRGWIMIVLGVVACYSPHPQTGSTCANGICPSPLVCESSTQTCERSVVDAGSPDTFEDLPDSNIDARLIDGCTPTMEICGDGTDQDCDGNDVACAANDRPAGAVDVTAGGMFFGDLRFAHDDSSGLCGGTGGRDLFYSVTVNGPQVYYFDTLGSNFDSVVRVLAGECSVASIGLACQDDACGDTRSQLALALPSGTSCIVVDQAASAETAGHVVLNVIPGGRDGEPLAPAIASATGDTCSSANIDEPLNQNCDSPGSGGKDLGYFITSCPGQTRMLDASTCNQSTNYDSVLYLRKVGGGQLACNDDDCGGANSGAAAFSGATVTNGLLFWLIIDGFAATECGPYRLDTRLQ